MPYKFEFGKFDKALKDRQHREIRKFIVIATDYWTEDELRGKLDTMVGVKTPEKFKPLSTPERPQTLFIDDWFGWRLYYVDALPLEEAFDKGFEAGQKFAENYSKEVHY